MFRGSGLKSMNVMEEVFSHLKKTSYFRLLEEVQVLAIAVVIKGGGAYGI